MNKHCTCPPDDCAELVRRALMEDQTAAEEMYDKFKPLLYAIARNRLGSDRSADLDDVVQILFMRVWVKLDTWVGRGNFCGWVATVAGRQAINEGIRLRHRRDEIEFDPDQFDFADKRSLDPGVLECFELVWSRFEPRWRETLTMRSRDSSVAEVAEHLDVSERTVKKWIGTMYSRLVGCLAN